MSVLCDSPITQLDCGGRPLDLSRPQVMGILNVTPDSFSDGGHYQTLDSALYRAEQMMSEGAAIIDVGGESTRPGAKSVSVIEEMDRVLPVIEAIRSALDVIVSVDTSAPELMLAAHSSGAGLLNDVRAFNRPNAEDAAAKTGLPVCCMHMQGQPQSMQAAPDYESVVNEVAAYLSSRFKALVAKGVREDRILLDPGFGFGKALEHNLLLLKELKQIVSLGCPILVGMSRKSMIGDILNAPLQERLSGSLAAAVLAHQQGAMLFRVHDVKHTVDALTVASRVLSSGL